MLACREKVSEIAHQLVKINSIVNTEGEREISDRIYSLISSFSYFQDNPNFLIKQQTVLDEKERYNIIAFVKGKKGKSKNTIILMGHIDTVGVDDFNKHSELAFDPNKYANALKHENLPELVKEHLFSGEYMFGRGSLDMKSGVASHLYLLNYYCLHPEELDGNLICVFECDEEDGSHGILSAVNLLNELKYEHQFEYIAAINSDFVTSLYEGDKHRYIYKGTVGKLLPTFYITGAESHAGLPFEGLDPNFIAAELTRQISYNPDLCNEANGEITLPPVSLKQTDFKPFYDVQTALSALVYYNFFSYSWSPQEVLALMKEQAEIAFGNALNLYKARYKRFCERANISAKEPSWDIKVYTYEELNTMLENEYGFRYIRHMHEFKENLLKEKSLDLRMYSVKVVEEAWKWMKDKSPAITVFFSSTYYPRVELTGERQKERNLLNALNKAIETIQPNYEYPIVTKDFFPYISDMSFVSISDNADSIHAVASNSPGINLKQPVNYEAIMELNVPVINIGPYGYDGHKKYERTEIEYSHYIVPNLTKLVIENLLEK